MGAPGCLVPHRGGAVAVWGPGQCFPLYCSGRAPGWHAWLGLGCLRKERVALIWGLYVRSPGSGEVMIWTAGLVGGVLRGIVVRPWSMLPFMPRQSIVLLVLMLARL